MENIASDDGGALCEINVTPMVDVLLSLLIIFMVTTPPPANTQLPLNLPAETKEQTTSDPTATLLLTLSADGTAKLGTQPLSDNFETLVGELKANEKLQTDGKVAIDAEKGVPYGKVVRMMSAAHEAGIPSVGIASSRF